MNSKRWTMLGVLALARVAMGFQFQSVASVSPFLVRDFGIDYATVGTMIGLYLLPGIVIAMPGGHLGRRYGDKRLVVFGLVLMALGGAVSGLAESYALAVFGRAIAGIGVVLQFVLMTKLLADWFSGREMVFAMAVYLNGWPVGLGLGLLTQAPLAEAMSWQIVFHATAVGAVLAAALVTVAYRDPPGLKSNAGPVSGRMSRREIMLVSLSGLLWALTNAGYVIVVSFAPLFMQGRGMAFTEAAAITSLATWLGVVGVPLGGYLALRLGRPTVFVVVCTLLGGVAVALLPLLGWYFVLFSIFGLFLFAPAGIVAALPLEVLREQNRGPGMGLFYTWWFAGMALLPPLGGWVRDLTGDAASSMYLAAALILASIPVLGAFRAFERRVPALTPPAGR